MKARADGADLEPRKRLRVLSLQGELRRDYRHTLPPGTLLFRCSRCQAVYPLNCFARKGDARYGFRPLCRWCRSRERQEDERHEPDEAITAKWCPNCRSLRPITTFTIDRRHTDGYAPACRDCLTHRKEERTRARHYDHVQQARREQTIRLCARLGIDVPEYDIKRCCGCGRVKHIDEFVNAWEPNDRKKSRCLDCHSR